MSHSRLAERTQQFVAHIAWLSCLLPSQLPNMVAVEILVMDRRDEMKPVVQDHLRDWFSLARISEARDTALMVISMSSLVCSVLMNHCSN